MKPGVTIQSFASITFLDSGDSFPIKSIFEFFIPILLDSGSLLFPENTLPFFIKMSSILFSPKIYRFNLFRKYYII